jgi:DNA invertase Pin-like site-specific DNA recombinase
MMESIFHALSDSTRRSILRELESLTGKLETGSPTRKLVFYVFAALAEFEHNLIHERTIAGLKAALAGAKELRGRSLSFSHGSPSVFVPTACAAARSS